MQETQLPIVALVYDFDGTLSPRNMQEFGFIQAIGKDPDEFWQRNQRLSEDNDANSVLCYMYLMLKEAHTNNISLRRESFHHFGAQVELFDGVCQWFELINEYGRSLGFDIKHYINSSGLKEMIEGTSIANQFENIFACSYLYDVDGVAYWPAVAVDFTAKTQFLFKINKGINTVSDNRKINEFIPEEQRPVPFKHMIYFGDGDTDIPSMKMVKEHGGHAIAVYGNESKRATASRLIKENRADYACFADYRQGHEMHQLVTKILNKIKSDVELDRLRLKI